MTTIFAIIMPVLLLFAGLVVDIGRLEVLKTQMQSAADAAVLGAELEAERGTGNWVAMGQADAALNGFTNGSNNVTISVSQQPTTGPYASRNDAIQVTISKKVQTIFLGALSGGMVTLNAQGVALMTPCDYFLGTGTLQSASLYSYTGSMLGDSCPIYVNTKVDVESNGHVVGTSVDINGTSAGSSVSGYIYPVYYGAQALSDPLAYETSPSYGGTCNHTSYSLSGGTATLSPGTYCKGMNIYNSTVTLSPGLYIITGGANFSNSKVSGNGVTLFFTTGGGGSYGQFIINNSSTVTISAPTDSSNGGIPGILVFADRNWVHTSAQDFIVTTSSFTGDGIWYLKNAGLYVWSCTSFQGNNYIGIDADNMYFGGGYVLNTNNYSNVSGGSPFRTVGALVQ